MSWSNRCEVGVHCQAMNDFHNGNLGQLGTRTTKTFFIKVDWDCALLRQLAIGSDCFAGHEWDADKLQLARSERWYGLCMCV